MKNSPHNDSGHFSDMSVGELKRIARECHYCYVVTECYGSSDIVNYLGSLQELEKRGYEAIESERGISFRRRT